MRSDARRSLAKIGQWNRLHPWVWTSFLLGCLAGLILCLPLVPYQMSDATASLLGAAIGAGAAVSAAYWVATEPERRRSRALGIRSMVSTVEGLQSFIRCIDLGKQTRSGDIVARAKLVQEASEMSERFAEARVKIEALGDHFFEVGVDAMAAQAQFLRTTYSLTELSSVYSEAIANRELVEEDLKQLTQRFVEDGVTFLRELDEASKMLGLRPVGWDALPPSPLPPLPR